MGFIASCVVLVDLFCQEVHVDASLAIINKKTSLINPINISNAQI